MKSCVVFDNAGLIDLAAVRTFGVSVKETDSPIGFFGTGLKFALAVLLREGCEVVLYRGTERFDFAVASHVIRDTDFPVVTMNGEPLAFTTQLGKTWALWQAFRELYCNALDESGETDALWSDPEGIEGRTRFVVSGAKFMNVWHDRDLYFLRQNSRPILAGERAEIHNGKSTAIFYRGIRVMSLPNPSLYTYNITRSVDLTEDRTMKYGFEAYGSIADAVLSCDDPALIEKVLTAGEANFEHRLDFDEWRHAEPSETFMGVCARLDRTRDRLANFSAMKFWRMTSRQNSVAEAAGIDLNPIESAILDRAKHFITLLGHDLSLYPIVVADTLGQDILGLAENGRIYLSRMCFDQGTKRVAGTLLEEFLHLHHKLRDCDRGMQNFLIDRLMSLGEQAVLKEPL